MGYRMVDRRDGCLGSKRVCVSCGSRFYDRGAEAPVCPRCGTVVSLPGVAAESLEETVRTLLEAEARALEAKELRQTTRQAPTEEHDEEEGLDLSEVDLDDVDLGDLDGDVELDDASDESDESDDDR